MRLPSPPMPTLPMDYHLNKFLLEIANNIEDEDLEALKYLLSGDGGFGRRTLEETNTATELFNLMKQKLYLDRENIIYLQSFLFNIGRRDLAKKCAAFAKRKNKLHFFLPNLQPEDDYEFLRCHVTGSLDHFTRVQLEQIRLTVANLLDCPTRYIIVNGLEPSESLLLTLMVPKDCVESILSASKKELSFLQHCQVDYIYIGNQVERKVEIPTLGHHVSEIRRIMEENEKLNADLDHVQAEFVKIKNENEKLHTEFQRAMSQEISEPGTEPKLAQFFSPHLTYPRDDPPPYQSIDERRYKSSYTSQNSHDRGSDEAAETIFSYTRSIKVSGLPKHTTEKELRRFFEDRRDRGGGPIHKVDLNQDHGTAYVTFTESAAVQRVLQNQPLMFRSRHIDIHAVSPHDESYMDLQEIPNEEELSTLRSEYVTLEVRGCSPKTAKSTLEDYFETEKSGGGEDSIETPIVCKEGVAYVTFKSKAAAERVLSKSEHRVDGAMLSLTRSMTSSSPQRHPQFYKDRVLVSGINPMSSRDGLESMLSNRSKQQVCKLDFGEDPTMALACFEGPVDIAALEKACRSKPHDNKFLRITHVPITCCLLVCNVAKQTTHDGLVLHFQYKAQGGEILKVQREESDSCIVHFQNPDVVQHICQRVHILDGNTLKVCPYYHCLGVPTSEEESRFQIPEDFTYTPKEPVKMHLLVKSNNAREKLRMKLEGTHAKFSVNETSDPLTLEVESTLAVTVKSCYTLARKWRRTTQRELDYFFDEITVKKHQLFQQVWESVEEKLKEFLDAEEKDVTIVLDKASCTVHVVGWEDEITDVYVRVGEVIMQTSEEFNKDMSLIEDKISLKSIDMKILKHNRELEKLKSESTSVFIEVDEDSKEVCFRGMPLDVYRSKARLMETINRMVPIPVGEFSQHRVDFLRSDPVSTYIQEQMLERGLDGIVDYGKNGHVVVYASSDAMAVDVAHFIKEAVVETPRQLSELSDKLLRSVQLSAEIERLETEYKGMVKIIPIPEDHSILTLVVASSYEGEVLEKVEDFLSNNAIVGKCLTLPQALVRYLLTYKDKDMDNIKEDLKDFLVEVEFTDSAVCVVGTEEGLPQAEQRILHLLREVVSKKFTWKKVNIVNYLKSDTGQLRVEKVEGSKNCVIEIYREEDAQGFPDGSDITSPMAAKDQSEVYAKCQLPSGQRVMVTLSDITVMAVDVIVNSADSGLKLEGGLARVVCMRGGPEIQKECAYFIQKRKAKLSNGEVYVSGPGYLKCKGVVHAVGPPWQGGEYKEELHLREAVIRSLEECDRKGWRSIAIPAISTGVFNYPMDKATLVITEALRDYFATENPQSGITEIHLCDINRSVMDAFTVGLQSTFSGVTVLQSSEKSPWKPYSRHKTGMAWSQSGIASSCSAIDDYDVFTLVLYGDSNEKLEEAVRLLQEEAEEDYHWSPVIEDDIIKEFGEKQTSKLEALERKHHVSIDTTGKHRIGRLSVYGLPSDITNVQEEIYKIINSLRQKNQIDKMSEYYARSVQWYYILESSEGSPIKCDKKMNMKLEEQYRSSEKYFVLESGHATYKVNFDEMKIKMNPNEQYKLLRRAVSEDTSDELPNHWSQMSEDHNQMSIALKPSTEEYIQVEKFFRSSLSQSSTLVRPRIVKIERIQNRTLWVQYNAMRKFLKKDFKGGLLERQLWHGTTFEATEGINSEGFNRRYCGANTKATLYGQGVYFATSASTSVRDMYSPKDQHESKRVYKCRVLTGEFTKGQPAMTMPPEVRQGVFYDSLVDDKDKPQVFVLFKDAQAYPEYLITFQ